MDRYKTYDATGLAPNGRLYAGDLNLFQDLVAALSSLTQNMQVGSLTVGESGLGISRYGAGEFQFAGAARVTGITRGLGGFIPGTYTTMARDAIPVGGAPYGLEILHTTLNRYEYNAGTDVARNWQPIGVTAAGITIVDIKANRPAASAVPAGTRFFATDQVVEWISDGSANWIRIGTPAGVTVSWYKSDGTAPAGFVKYDGTSLPSSTGIYADLYAHLGTVNTPDTRGRAEFGVGTHADIDIVGDNDGIAVGSRRPKHKTSINDPNHDHGGVTGISSQSLDAYAAPSDPNAGYPWGSGHAGMALSNAHTHSIPAGATGITAGPNTGAEPTDMVPYIATVKIAKL